MKKDKESADKPRRKKFSCTITLIEPVLGTVPKNKEIYRDYIATKAPANTDTIEEIETIEEMEEKGWTGFHADEEGYFVYNYWIKGFMKNAANVLKNELDVKALKSKIDNYLFVFPRKIRLPQIDDRPLERPLRGMTPMGERVTLVRSDTVSAGTTLEFTLLLLAHPEIDEEVLRNLLDYGELKGLGQWRNGGYGSFTYTLKEIEA